MLWYCQAQQLYLGLKNVYFPVLVRLQGECMLISNSLFTGLGLSRCKACVLVTILKVTDNKIIVVM